MGFKKVIAVVTASSVMAMSATSFVMNLKAYSEDRSETSSAMVTVELNGLTDEYLKNVPLKTLIDKMTYARDIYEKNADNSASSEASEAREPESETEAEGAEETSGGITGYDFYSPEDNGEAVIDVSPETGSNYDNLLDEDFELTEPTHLKGDKVEIGEDAEYIWIGDEQFSLSDEEAVVDLTVEDSENEYIIETVIVIGGEDRDNPANRALSAEIAVTKGYWSFDGFRFYTQKVINDELDYITTKAGAFDGGSLVFRSYSAVETGKNVYLDAEPSLLTGEGEAFEDFEYEVTYHGTHQKRDNILTDGAIVIDIRALDQDGCVVGELSGITVSIVEEKLLLWAQLGSDDAVASVIDDFFPLILDSDNTAALEAIFRTDAPDAEYALKINKLALQAAGLVIGEDDIQKAVVGYYDDPADEALEELADIKAELFGGGFSANYSEGAEFTLFVSPDSVQDLAEPDAAAFIIHLNVKAELPEAEEPNEPDETEPNEPDATEPNEPDATEPNEPDETEPNEPDETEPDKPDVTEPNEPDVTEPNEPDETEPNEPDVTEPDEPEEPKLYTNCGDTLKVYFDNIRGYKYSLIIAYTGAPEKLEASLKNAENVVLGEIEYVTDKKELEKYLSCFKELDGVGYDGAVKVNLYPFKDSYGGNVLGGISGSLVISAKNTEPMIFELEGYTGYTKIVERNTSAFLVKYIPFRTEFRFDSELSWSSVSYSAVGDLPDGLYLDPESGVLSGVPTEYGEFDFTVKAEITYSAEDGTNEILTSAVTRDVTLNILNNTAKNLHTATDPNYGFFQPLGDTFDGKAYYLSAESVLEEQRIVLVGDCSEFSDLWLNGVKLKRTSDDFKMMHGNTLITLKENALSDLELEEVNTLVFGFKPNGSDSMKFTAQNVVITKDKSKVVPAAEDNQFRNVYTPSNVIYEDIDPEFANALSNLKVYINDLPQGTRLIVKPVASPASSSMAMRIMLVNENGEISETDKSIIAQVKLPDVFLVKAVFLYEVKDGEYSLYRNDVKGDMMFFTVDQYRTYVVSDVRLNSDGTPAETRSGNPSTGVAVSGTSFILSTAALVMILTNKRGKKENKGE